MNYLEQVKHIFEDPVTIASLLIPGVSYAKLGTTFLRRLAGFSLANASFNTVAELIQSDRKTNDKRFKYK